MGQELGRVQVAVLALEILKHITQRRGKESSDRKNLRERWEKSWEYVLEARDVGRILVKSFLGRV